MAVINPRPHPHHTKFRYNDALISSCASSQLAHSLSSQRENSKSDDGGGGDAANNQDCKSLFEQHTVHYNRPPLSNEELQFWMIASLESMSPRIEAFLRSVLFVHNHNDDIGKHKVALNRFSDMLEHELPLMTQSSTDGGDARSGDRDSFDPLQSALDSVLSPLQKDIMLDSERESEPVFILLDDDEMILKFGESIRQLQQQRLSSQQASNSDDNGVTSASIYNNKHQRLIDSWWWIGGGHHGKEQQVIDASTPDDETNDPSLARHSSRKKIVSKSKDNSSLLDKENKMGGLADDVDNDAWEHYLDWSTVDNPDGVPIVHDAIDQLLCGSCWAISATGTLEASIARNMAYSTYEDTYSSVQKSSDDMDPRLFAVAAAQQIEQQSISTADLSVQELVDCDTRYDQGCAGGNPLLAFYFLHRFGVTSTKNYPYTGTMGTCNYHKVDQPIATVKTWGILTPDHENNMEKVLRYIGPVAVGLIGADPAFLGYEEGIFVSSKGGKCDSSQADHAMLIVGYGQEISKDGTVQKYWIARNSWGAGWGENGYVKVARVGGRKGKRGICGIARSPSVALGGMFTKDVVLDQSGVYGSTRSGERWNNDGGRNPDTSPIERASSQIQSAAHRLRLRIGFLQKGILITTMDDNDNNKDVDAAMPIAIIMAILAALLLFTQMTRNRRCRCRRELERSSSDAASIATSWSTRVLCHGTHGDDRSHQDDGERSHLLANSSGTLYTYDTG